MLVSPENGVGTQAKGRVVRRDDEAFPACLRELGDEPRCLYVIGNAEALLAGGLAVIGARKATPYGLAASEMAGRVAAECGITVISGGAMGCDAAALRGAQRAGGITVVVPGTGADVVYPASSRDVFEQAVAGGGCVVSLERWQSPPRRYAFPKRNRVIAALCDSLFVAEAGERSGTFSTAETAVELGRRVYAIPGSIFSPQSLGANRLIAEGAAIICSEEELELQISLDFGVGRLVAPGMKREGGRVLSALTASPMRPDDLANHLGRPAIEMLMRLSDYEAAGLVVRLPDGRYAPSERYLIGTGQDRAASGRLQRRQD